MTAVSVRALLRAYGTLIALVAIIAVFSVLSPDAFATAGNAFNVLRQISVLVLVATGATLVMAAGEFDLSVGAMASLGGVAAAQAAVAGWPVGVQLLTVLPGALALGCLNGFIVTGLRVLSFIATLAMGTVLGGLTFWLSGGSTVFENVPASFAWLGRGEWLHLAIPTWVMLAVVVAASLMMRKTVFGRQLLAVGGNPVAAHLSGIAVPSHKTLAFALCSLLSALAGLLLASRIGSAQPMGGDALFLPAYAAAFLGVTASREGVPNVPGTLAGAAILGVLANGLTILNCPTFLQQMLTGAIVIVAVTLQRIGGRT